MRQDQGREVARQLIRSADVVIENFRPGRMEAWGLGYAELCRRQPQDRDDPGQRLRPVRSLQARPGFGTVAETASGYAFLNGWPDTPPTAPPFGFADSIAGISAAFGTSMALFRREMTGQGSEVDVALYEPLMFILGDAVLNYTATGEIMQRHGNASGAASPRGIYQAGDGTLALDRRLQPVDRAAPVRGDGAPRPQGRPAVRHQHRPDGQQRRDAEDRHRLGQVLHPRPGAGDPGQVRGRRGRGQRRQGRDRGPALQRAHAGRAGQHRPRAGADARVRSCT